MCAQKGYGEEDGAEISVHLDRDFRPIPLTGLQIRSVTCLDKIWTRRLTQSA